MAYPPIPLPYTTNQPWSFLVWLLMWGVIRGHTIRETEMKANKLSSRTAAHSITVLTTETERTELTSDTGDPLSFFFFYLPCETTNLSKSGLPTIQLSRTNGEQRGSDSRGSFPESCHTSHKVSGEEWVKRSNHCLVSTAPPFNCLWTFILVWLLDILEPKLSCWMQSCRADRGLQLDWCDL